MIALSHDDATRKDLRNLLLRSLEPDTIKWGHSIQSASSISHTAFELTFTRHRPETTSSIIRADGVFSRVRPVLHTSNPHTPRYQCTT